MIQNRRDYYEEPEDDSEESTAVVVLSTVFEMAGGESEKAIAALVEAIIKDEVPTEPPPRNSPWTN